LFPIASIKKDVVDVAGTAGEDFDDLIGDAFDVGAARAHGTENGSVSGADVLFVDAWAELGECGDGEEKEGERRGDDEKVDGRRG